MSSSPALPGFTVRQGCRCRDVMTRLFADSDVPYVGPRLKPRHVAETTTASSDRKRRRKRSATRAKHAMQGSVLARSALALGRPPVSRALHVPHSQANPAAGETRGRWISLVPSPISRILQRHGSGCTGSRRCIRSRRVSARGFARRVDAISLAYRLRHRGRFPDRPALLAQPRRFVHEVARVLDRRPPVAQRTRSTGTGRSGLRTPAVGSHTPRRRVETRPPCRARVRRCDAPSSRMCRNDLNPSPRAPGS